jgi:hypothetical protein
MIPAESTQSRKPAPNTPILWDFWEPALAVPTGTWWSQQTLGPQWPALLWASYFYPLGIKSGDLSGHFQAMATQPDPS